MVNRNWKVTKYGFWEIPNFVEGEELFILAEGNYSKKIPHTKGKFGIVSYVNNINCESLRAAAFDFRNYLTFLKEKFPYAKFKVLAFSKANIIAFFALKDMSERPTLIAAGVPAEGSSIISKNKIFDVIDTLPKKVTEFIQKLSIRCDLERDLAPESMTMGLFDKEEYANMIDMQYVTKIGKWGMKDLLIAPQDILLLYLSRKRLQDGVLTAEEQNLPTTVTRTIFKSHAQAVEAILWDLRKRPV